MIPVSGVAQGLVAGQGQAPNQSQAYAQLLQSLMGGGSLGSQQQQPLSIQAAPPIPDQALLDKLTRSRDMQEMGYGQNPNASWGNAIAAIAAPIAGRRREAKAEEAMSEAAAVNAAAAKAQLAEDRLHEMDSFREKELFKDSLKDPVQDPEWQQKIKWLQTVPEGPQRDAYAKMLFRGGVTVNNGDSLPTPNSDGQVVVADPDSPAGVKMVDVEGGKADLAKQAEEERLGSAQRSMEIKVGNVNSTIDELRDQIGWDTAGMGGKVMRYFAGSDATDFEAEIKMLEGNLAFDRLQQMRAESKTGGALGAVSELELTLLKSTVAGYDPNMSAEGKQRFLDKVQRHYNNFLQIEESQQMPEEYAQFSEVKTVNGKTYGRDADGNFYELGEE